MDSDAAFRRTAFGGFNREDVVSYIQSVSENTEKLASELENEKKKNNSLKNELDGALKQLEDMRTQFNETGEKLKTAEIRLEEITKSFREETRKINKSHKAQIESIKNEYEEKIQSLQSRALSDTAAEQRIGTAMLDVRRYADMLVKEACDKVSVISEDADEAVTKTLSRVRDISSGIKAFSDKINCVLADLIDENEQLANELRDFNGTLKAPFDDAVGKLNTQVLGE